jgi:O-antigen ligase
MTKLLPSPFVLTAAVLSSAMLLGGGQGHLGDTLTQLLAVAALAGLLWQFRARRDWPVAACLAVLPVLAVLLYLLPAPDLFIQAGSTRQALASDSAQMGIPAAKQAALIPSHAERALYWLLPAFAVFMGALKCSTRQRMRLAAVAVFWILLGAVIGLAQKAVGADSLLYFFGNTNRGASVGLFANANHYAIAMAAGLPLVWVALTLRFNETLRRRVNPLWFLGLSGIAILFILGFLLSGSRAGLVLGMLGCFLMLPAVISADQREGAKHWMFAVMAIGLLVAVQVGLYFIVLNFEENPLQDGRWQINAASATAAAAFAPSGSGPGSFWYVFPQFENFMFGNVIVNHAHNDYLELWLEMRWIFMAVALLLFAAYFVQGYRLWFKADNIRIEAKLLARAAWIGILLLLLHSLVDYPLRTTAISSFAGLLAALLVIPQSAYLEAEAA